ncbi:unnamed protein product [Bursaphelenchus okinawaensis]|uniref:G_PROTEIN_RECEP_F1_2 domain-containing protein n=1 Tax=Bursaphelenchus okinawaensis TaxID=465554 RepID=A0A811LVS0_9BILA|nr:unnamed protein product [Bursaphelenchus okinawaensis]CAG9128486.1 unnamed protein product [Bursaphelenchus okinawaensis]
MLAIGYVTLLHSLGNILPPCYVSYENGDIILPTLYHSAMSIAGFCMIFFDLKYFLVALERKIAFSRKATYENEGAGTGNRLVLSASVFSLIYTIGKNMFIWKTQENLDLDQRLTKVTMVDKYFPGLIMSYIVASTAIFYAIYVFLKISSQIHVLESNSLSERYELRQIVAAMAWLRKLIKAFGIAMIFTFPFMVIICYLYFAERKNEDDKYMQILLTIIFCAGSAYSLVTTYFMFSEFPQLRNAVAKDFPFCAPKISTSVLSQEERDNMYYNSLNVAWRHPEEPKSIATIT